MFAYVESEPSNGRLHSNTSYYRTESPPDMNQTCASRTFFVPPDDSGGVDASRLFRYMNDMVNDLTRPSDADDHACQVLLNAIPSGPKKVRGVLKTLHPHMPSLILDKIAEYMCRSDYMFCVDVDAMVQRYTPTFVNNVPNHNMYIAQCRGQMRSMGAYESDRKKMAELYENASRLLVNQFHAEFANSTNGIDQRTIKEKLRVSAIRNRCPTRSDACLLRCRPITPMSRKTR